MKIIECKEGEKGNVPAEPFPDSAVQVVFNGKVFIVYEDGDEIPSIDYQVHSEGKS